MSSLKSSSNPSVLVCPNLLPALLTWGRDRTPISSLKRFEWVRTIRQLDDKFVLEHSSLDAYLYLRFLRTAIFICFVGTVITWIILL